MTTRANAPTKIVLPMLTFVPGAMGGSETYARELIRALGRIDDLDVTSLVSRAGKGFAESGHEVVARRVAGGASTGRRLTTIGQSLLDPEARRALAGADVVHYPFTVPAPRAPRSAATVTTLLDVQHHDLPKLFSAAERRYRSLTYDRTARRADAVVTISEFSRTTIVEHLGISPDQVIVAHLGVDATAFTPQLGARQNFVLYPARGWPHKNHARLVAAMELLRERQPDLRLVLTGGSPEELGAMPDWVEQRGQVSRAELEQLYATAGALAFPSLYEGFGLPPLEAMASGCPVAAASAGSLPEICGDAAVMFDPRDVTDMANAIELALNSRERLMTLGLANIERFTWQACAEVHANLYRRLASKGR